MTTVENTLDFLNHLYELKEISNMTPILKDFSMSRQTTVALLNKGLLQKFRGDKPVSISTKGNHLVYRWKHPETRPNINTATALNALISNITKTSGANHRIKKKSVFIKGKSDLVRTEFYSELCKLREKYEKELGVELVLTVDIITKQTFEI